MKKQFREKENLSTTATDSPTCDPNNSSELSSLDSVSKVSIKEDYSNDIVSFAEVTRVDEKSTLFLENIQWTRVICHLLAVI